MFRPANEFVAYGDYNSAASKRYFAEGRPVALQRGDELYYTVNDPSGVAQLITDETGAEVGRMVFDSFGGVLSATLPLSLTQALPGLPDPATGLVHLGQGRWLDPVWGRPLQPNPAGGPPTIPQALNRYAATPAGQPGTYEAEASSWNPFTDDRTSNIGKAFASNYINRGLEWGLDAYSRASLRTTTETFWRTVYHRVPRSALVDEALTVSYAFGSFTTGGFGNGLFKRLYALNSRFVAEEVPVSISITSHHLPAGRIAEKFIASRLGRLGLDVGVGFVVDVGYQILLDFDNPYLSREQMIKRAVLGQGTGSIASFVGGGLAGAAFGGPVGFVVGVGISIFWDMFVAPQIYELIGAVPTRDLAPFSGNQ